MDGKPRNDAEGVEFPEWELLHHHHHSDAVVDDDLGPQLESAMIRPDYFSLHPLPPSSSNSSSTDPTEVERNFDDSFLANQLFPSSVLHPHPSSPSSSTSSNLLNPLSHDSDSDSDSISKATLLPHTTTPELLDDAAALDSEEEERQEKQIDRKRETVWWKVPFEVFKYWVGRVSPVPLSIAAAAAFLGLLILGRRLYKMKRKTQTLKLNVALDDKKVSQLMGRVARLNEAFSVVKRVPIIRPSLPAPSVTLRPVMSMR